MKKIILQFFYIACISLLIFSIPLFAQTKLGDAQIGIPQAGAIGISRTTDEIMQLERSTAALQLNRPPRLSVEHEVERDDLTQNPESPEVDRFPAGDPADKSQPRINSITSPQTLGLTFLGATLADANAFPPDVMGMVGSTQFIVAINGRIRSFNKTTGAADGVLNADMDVFFSTVMSTQSGTFTSDPRIRYDRITGRWFVIIIDVPAGTGTIANRLLIAVSNTSTIAGGTVWTYFYFVPNASQFADYPTLGIDKNALYIGFNMFTLSGSYAGTIGYVVKKSSILASGPIVATSLGTFATSSGVGPFTPQGIDNFDTTATEGYFIGCDNASYGLLQIRRVSNPGGTPTVSGNLSITVPTTDASITVPHLGNTGGSSGYLDALDDRLFAAVIRNGRLWTSHNISVNSSGVASSGDRNGSRWYEIGTLTTTPALIQSGTVYDNSSNVRNYWIPSVNISGQGHIAMGFSTAGTNERINGGTIGRLATDVTGTMQTPVLYTSSSTAYNPASDPGDATYGRRWGDYSYTSVDPNDDMTMWTIQEYCSSTDNWGVQVVKLIAPPPATAASTSPSSVNTNTSNINVTITGTSSSGSGFFDPGPVFSNRLAATVNGGGLTVNSVTFTDATHLTINISVAAGATPGARTITVTNPDGQSATSATGILTINNVSCPTITMAPTTLLNAAAGSAYSQTITASGGASPYTYALTSGSLPSGITLSSAGLISGTSSFGGTFNFTITATDNNTCTGLQAYTLTVTGCSQITVAPNSLPSGTIGTAYSQTISASGGTSPYSYSVTTGALPVGLTLVSSTGVISGTPTVTGTSNFTITATDANTCTASQAYSIVINCVAITLSPTTLPSGTTNVAYSQTITATGGTAPYTFAVTSGTLPTGLTLSVGGVLSGTPTVAGTSSITITATDANACTGSRAYTLTITAPSSSSTSLTTLGVAYSQDFNALAISGTSSTVPSGWAFSETGTNANTTYSAGTGSSNSGDTWSYGPSSNTDRAFGGLQSSNLVSTIGANFTNNTGSSITSLDISYYGEEWRLGTRSRFDTLKFQYSMDATSLTTGMWTSVNSLNYITTDTSGVAGLRDGNTIRSSIIGTIPGLNISNGSIFWIKWLDANATSSDDGLAVDDFLLTPQGAAPTNPSVVGTANPSTVVAGNSILLTATVTPGTNPASTGIVANGNLSSIGGSVSQLFYDDGTHGDATGSDNIFSNQATVSIGATPGSKSLRVYVTDAQARADSTDISLTVNALPTNPSVVGTANPSTVAAGTSTLLTATVTLGTNPTSTGIGVTGNLSSIGGSVSQLFYDDGTHGDITVSDNIFSYQTTVSVGTIPGLKSLRVYVTDAQSRTDSTNISLTVNSQTCPTVTLSPSTLSNAFVGISYNQNITSTGGKTPYTYAVTAGILTSGLSLSSAGELSGTPSSLGSSTFTITATDSNGCSGSNEYTLQVSCPTLIINPAGLTGDSVGETFSQILNAAGGTAPYSFVVTGGALPDSLELSPSGVLAGKLKVAGNYNFTVNVTDLNGCTANKSYSLIVYEVTLGIQVPFTASWNLLSIPVTGSNGLVSVLFPTAVSEAFAFTLGGYLGGDHMIPGFGYWLKFNSTDTASIAGLPIEDDTVDVNAGWNLIGSISQSIPVSGVSGLGTTIQSDLFGYNNIYSVIDTIKPGTAFWVKVDAVGKLRLSRSLGMAGINTKQTQSDKKYEMLDHLEFVDARGLHQSLYFGSEENRTSANQHFELPPTPPAGAFDVRFASQQMVEVFSSQIQKSQKQSIIISSEAYPVTVKWEVLPNTSQRYKLQIQDGKKIVKDVPLSGVGSIRLEDSEIKKLNLVLRNNSSVPLRFALHQNYPNPFNPITTIEYQLPVESRVSVKIFNVLGQVIQVLKDEIQSAGYESVDWNASDIASGLYFYKLEATSTSDPNIQFTQIRKMLLLK